MQDIVASNKDYSGLLQPHDDYFTLQHYAGKVSFESALEKTNHSSELKIHIYFLSYNHFPETFFQVVSLRLRLNIDAKLLFKIVNRQ